MKKFLLFIIFLLTLFPLLGMVDGSTIMAQHWTYEDGSNWLPDLEVGSNNERCDECGHFYDPEEGHECWYKCEYCYEIVSDLNRHYKYSQACAIAAGYKDDEVSHCPFCGRELEEEEYCTCANLVVPETKPSGGGVGGGSTGSGTGGGSSGSVGGYWYPNNNNVDINPPFNPTHQKIDGEHLFKENLPAQSMKQETSMTCVPTAMANLLSHMGSQQSPQEMRKNIEVAYDNLYSDEKRLIKRDGVNINDINDFMEINGFVNISLSDIIFNIDNSVPCLAVIDNGSGFMHMMEIVGYFDNNNYYKSSPEAFQCIDPGTGQYTTIRIEKLQKYSNYIYSK